MHLLAFGLGCGRTGRDLKAVLRRNRETGLWQWLAAADVAIAVLVGVLVAAPVHRLSRP